MTPEQDTFKLEHDTNYYTAERMKNIRFHERPLQFYIEKLDRMIMSAAINGRNSILLSDLSRSLKHLPQSQKTIDQIIDHFYRKGFQINFLEQDDKNPLLVVIRW